MEYQTTVADSNLLEKLFSSQTKTNEERLQLIAEFRFNQTITICEQYLKARKEKIDAEIKFTNFRQEVINYKDKLGDIIKISKL